MTLLHPTRRPPQRTSTTPGFFRLAIWRAALVAALGLASVGAGASAEKGGARTLPVATKPGQPWKAMATRTMEDFPALPADPALNQYGGRKRQGGKATGFFRTEQIGGRWWLVDPEGGLFINQGVASVRETPTKEAREARAAKFGDEAAWAAQTTALLRAHGFNGVGSWANVSALRKVVRPLVQTRLWNFMSSYGKQRGGTTQQPGHTGYPGDCPFIFDPEFEAFCDAHARQLAAEKDDPWLLGHYTDNELPWKRTLLAGYLALAETDPGHRAALDWLRQRHGAAATAADITEQDKAGFLEYAAERYFRITSAAIRKYDPHHLILGARFHEVAFRDPELYRAAGRHTDVVTVNYYRAWTPDPALLAMWARESGRPVLITEWYAKAEDSGMGNTGGAGWLVRTQRERGQFYQNFALGLLESRVCVGWHWFKYTDNDPTDKAVDPSNRDSNKGILNNRYEPYTPLLDAMKQLNERTFGLAEYFDRLARK